MTVVNKRGKGRVEWEATLNQGDSPPHSPTLVMYGSHGIEI